MKKYLLAASVLAVSLSTMASVLPPTATVTFNKVIATPNVSGASVKILTVNATGQGPQQNQWGLTDFYPKYLPQVMQNINTMGFLQNVYTATPGPGYSPAPYYIWFGITKAGQTIYPASCEILLNATKTVNSVIIHQNYCTVS